MFAQCSVSPALKRFVYRDSRLSSFSYFHIYPSQFVCILILKTQIMHCLW